MNAGLKLLVFNFAMDPEDPLLSHQYEAVRRLSEYFKEITVITGRMGDVSLPENITVISTRWVPGRSIANLQNFYKEAMRVIFAKNYDSVFFHMTDLQCSLIAPILWLKGDRQVLWYAHAHKSKYLVFAKFWVTSIVTSTPGSCPINGKKVKYIGQAIDHFRFTPIESQDINLNQLIHIGRFDKSKQIEKIISEVTVLRETFTNLRLTLIGSPASFKSVIWAEEVKTNSEPFITEGWLRFEPAIPRSTIPNILADFGCFIHAYEGSLDKTLIESTMLGIPVVTINPEYLDIFGSWSGLKHPSLHDEYVGVSALDASRLKTELEVRRQLAIDNHSLDGWTSQLVNLLERRI